MLILGGYPEKLFIVSPSVKFYDPVFLQSPEVMFRSSRDLMLWSDEDRGIWSFLFWLFLMWFPMATIGDTQVYPKVKHQVIFRFPM
jgi:hypothetical protein